MRAQQFHVAPIERYLDTVIYHDGEEIVRITATEMTMRHPDGHSEHRKLHPNTILDDYSNFNPAMMFGQNPVELAICPLCRRPPYTFPLRDRPKVGLIRLSNAKRCAQPGCGVLCCPRHRRLCSDGHYRCTRCARKWRIAQIPVSLIFARAPD